MSFASRFKYLRENVKNWTQDDAADAFGVSRSTIAGYESETKSRIPRQHTLQKIADTFGVSLDFLIGGQADGQLLAAKTAPEVLVPGEDGYIRSEGVVYAPIVAEVACGSPLYTEDRIEGYYPLDSDSINVSDGPYVWVKAKGDSMVNARVYDGSFVLLRLQPQVDSGEIAAVCIDSEMATLKRVYFLSDGIMLAPENSEYKPITYEPERVRIVGKALRVVSDYHL